MLFRFSRVHLAKAFLGRQSSGLCVVDVRFAAAVLATDPTAGIQCANHGSRIRSAAADDDVILIFYQGYVARVAPLEYQELLLTLEEARRKILAKTRRLPRGLTHQLDRAPSP